MYECTDMKIKNLAFV